jgi:hypothetical protein
VAALIVRISDDAAIALNFVRPHFGGRRGAHPITTCADLMASFARPTVQAATTAAVAVGADHALMFKAAKTVAEYRLLRWLADANSRGVAPPTAMLLAKLRACWPVDGTGARSNGFLDSLRQKKRLARTGLRGSVAVGAARTKRCRPAPIWATRNSSRRRAFLQTRGPKTGTISDLLL